ncbi:tryptophan halogenase family protein [Asticcacaulis sp. 201]|uniref:tryptophan halogenase family protein n=1 Tax=Asticcacaulis sp. 201 TaxID=3028787 RepID=UPI002916CC02|nr:tryptophan halogenase family protein [Asticcacaulis sp. 201]MDV6331347.1 tryptophan halogenase family protein [Asticcacaulis sp. 201]
MAAEPIKTIVILGGGTAGWLSATFLNRILGDTVDITLIESDDIGTVGVGEATIPPLVNLLVFLGLDEREVMKAVQGTYKLGIEFIDWYEKGEGYSHAFGAPGNPLGVLPFHQYWLRQRMRGKGGSLWDYSLNHMAAKANRFTHMKTIPNTPNMEGMNYALHFDAGLLAKYLRGHCEAEGVIRREGKVAGVNLRAEDGFIESLSLETGETVGGDFFLDCSGFHGVLIEGALKAGYEDWTHWLPCDRALAVPCTSAGPLKPYTQARAHTAGWQWRIPLQHRTGNGHVFSSAFMETEAAAKILLANLDGEPLAEPRLLKFTTGRRRKTWVKNCVALGLASGFMEPLESTSIHLVQTALQRLAHMFPDTGFNPIEIAEYNRKTQCEYERIRDFLVLHYTATKRNDSPFWTHCRTMAVPESLSGKVDFFRQHGRVIVDEDDLFKEANWVQVLIGQGVMPESCSPLTLNVPEKKLDDYFQHIRQIYEATVTKMPSHAQYVAYHCKAET